MIVLFYLIDFGCFHYCFTFVDLWLFCLQLDCCLLLWVIGLTPCATNSSWRKQNNLLFSFNLINFHEHYSAASLFFVNSFDFGRRWMEFLVKEMEWSGPQEPPAHNPPISLCSIGGELLLFDWLPWAGLLFDWKEKLMVGDEISSLSSNSNKANTTLSSLIN